MGIGRLEDTFLTPIEKDTFVSWKDQTKDNTISNMVLGRLWDQLANLVPETVAPNVLSLAGLLCSIHAWYIVQIYISSFPLVSSLGAIALIALQLNFDGIDGRHAKNTMQDTPLGELFGHSCNLLGYVFSALTGSMIVGISDPATQWYIIQIGQLFALSQHFGAFKRKSKVLWYPMFTGPGEVIFFFLLLLLVKAVVGFGPLVTIFSLVSPTIAALLNVVGYSVSASDNVGLFAAAVQVSYYTLGLLIVLEVLFTLPHTARSTRNGLVFCLIYRMFPSLLFYLGMHNDVTTLDIIIDGLFMTILTTDVIVCKMTARDIHPLVVILAMLSLFNHVFTMLLILFYYVTLFYEISEYMEISMFSVTVNVFVDGAYDMCHLGHINSFKQALLFGTRLFVGVLSDESIASYKRKPIMSMAERCAIVATSRYVHKVIPDSPITGITEEFLKKHRIHIVCHSPEYNGEKGELYYGIPRRLGITRVTGRTEGMSTSELIKRVKRYEEEGNVNKQEANWAKLSGTSGP